MILEEEVLDVVEGVTSMLVGVGEKMTDEDSMRDGMRGEVQEMTDEAEVEAAAEAAAADGLETVEADAVIVHGADERCGPQQE